MILDGSFWNGMWNEMWKVFEIRWEMLKIGWNYLKLYGSVWNCLFFSCLEGKKKIIVFVIKVFDGLDVNVIKYFLYIVFK